MTDIDTMVREFRASLPEPQMGPADQVARQASERTPRRARRVGRLVAIGAGGVATAGLATVLGVLFLAGGSGTRIHQASPARVSWGQLITVRVTTDDGVDQQALMDRVAGLIAKHGEDTHRPGIRVEQLDAERLQVTAPGAKWVADTNAAIPQFSGVVAFEPDSVLATGKVLDDFARFADPAPTPETAWAVGPGRPEPYGAVLVSDRAEAEAYAKTLGDADLLPLRATHRVLVRQPAPPGQPLVDEPLILAARDEVIDAGDITQIRLDGSNLVVDIREGSRARVSDALVRHANSTKSWPVVMTMGPGMRSAPSVFGAVSIPDSASDGSRIVVIPDRNGEGTAKQIAEGPFIAGETVVESTEPYGQIPPLVGERAQLPDWLERDRKRTLSYASSAATTEFHEIPADSIVKVVTVETPAGTRDLWAGRAPDGTDAYWLTLNGRPDQLSVCDPGLGAPVATNCGGIAGGSAGDVVALGRTGPEVASIERVSGDSTLSVGTVRDGWYVVAWGKADGPAGEAPTLVAKDASGRVIARNEKGFPNWTPVP